MFTADFKPTPYWWECAAPSDEGAVEMPDEVDVAVIGGGYAGLSTALELARHGLRVAVLEADKFGSGASTRNGGHVSSASIGKGPGGARAPLSERLGDARMAALYEDGAASVTHLEQLIAREEIDCALNNAGRFLGAFTPAHYATLAPLAEQLNAAGDNGAEVLPRDRQREEIGSDFYYGGMLVRHSFSVHPALLHRGLLEACRGAGVMLCPHNHVDGIARDGAGYVLSATGGQVRAREVVAGTNGYTGKATPWLRRRLIPAASYIIATEDLGEARARELIPKNRNISDTKRILNYYRLSPDRRRLIFGGRARLAMRDPKGTAPILYRLMLRIFPQLAGVRISHAWTGSLAFTFDFLPHMGRSDGVHYIAGCNGNGVAMMSYLGHQTAVKILGLSNRACAFDELPFPGKPFYGGTPWFLPIVSSYYRLRDGIDRRRAG